MSSGGGGYFPKPSPKLKRLTQESKQEADKQRIDSDINKYLSDMLSSYERDPKKVQKCLEEIGSILKDKADMVQFLFGGSVAKHTYVDGLSDIDALVVLNRDDVSGESPDEILGLFEQTLNENLATDKIAGIEKGNMAITVKYKDGTEIQLLPALRSGSNISISNAQRSEWKEINPRAFQGILTSTNQRLNGSLIPSIKLVKSIVADFPEQKRLSGYHIESLALEAMKGYRGPKTVQAIVKHIFEDASSRVMTTVSDVTGQSRAVDEYLGSSNSTKRKVAADALRNTFRRLDSAQSVVEWKKILEG